MIGAVVTAHNVGKLIPAKVLADNSLSLRSFRFKNLSHPGTKSRQSEGETPQALFNLAYSLIHTSTNFLLTPT